MAPCLCWFTLLTLSDPLYKDRTESRIYNSVRSTLLRKSAEEQTGPGSRRAASVGCVPVRRHEQPPSLPGQGTLCVHVLTPHVYHYDHNNRSLRPGHWCGWGQRGWCCHWAEELLKDQYWKTASRANNVGADPDLHRSPFTVLGNLSPTLWWAPPPNHQHLRVFLRGCRELPELLRQHLQGAQSLAIRPAPGQRPATAPWPLLPRPLNQWGWVQDNSEIQILLQCDILKNQMNVKSRMIKISTF